MPALTWTKHPAVAQEPSKTLVLMFPGVGDGGETYVDHGFVQRLQAARAVDVVTVDAYRQFFGSRRLLARVEQDVLVPARERGYAQIWIVGISVGGTGALLTARHFENDIDGVVLFSPYLGHSRVIEGIVAEGGIRRWKPPAGKRGWTVDLWRWIQGYTRGERRPTIYLAAGTDDMWGISHRLLAEVVPPEQVFTRPGGHSWKVWSPLWTRMLEAGAIATPPVVMPAVDQQRVRPCAMPPTTASLAGGSSRTPRSGSMGENRSEHILANGFEPSAIAAIDGGRGSSSRSSAPTTEASGSAWRSRRR